MTKRGTTNEEAYRLYLHRDQIEAVFVDGTMRLWKGWPIDWDGRALMRQVAEVALRDVARAPIQRVHPLADAHRASNA